MKKLYKEKKVFDVLYMGEVGSLLQQLSCYEEVSNDTYVSYVIDVDDESRSKIDKFFLDQGCVNGEEVIVYRWW